MIGYFLARPGDAIGSARIQINNADYTLRIRLRMPVIIFKSFDGGIMKTVDRLPDWSLGEGYAAQVEIVLDGEDIDLTGSSVSMLLKDGATQSAVISADVVETADGGTYDLIAAPDELPDTAKQYDYWLWLYYSSDASPKLLQSGKMTCKPAQLPGD